MVRIISVAHQQEQQQFGVFFYNCAVVATVAVVLVKVQCSLTISSSLGVAASSASASTLVTSLFLSLPGVCDICYRLSPSSDVHQSRTKETTVEP